MRIYEENTITFRFENSDEGDEIAVVKGLYKKLDEKTRTAGFKKEFSNEEIDLIRGMNEYLNRKIEIKKYD